MIRSWAIKLFLSMVVIVVSCKERYDPNLGPRQSNYLVVEDVVMAMNRVSYFIILMSYGFMKAWKLLFDQLFKCICDQELPVTDDSAAVPFSISEWFDNLPVAVCCDRTKEMSATGNIIAQMIKLREAVFVGVGKHPYD